jgi:alpha-1,3-rhamnosyl/mannosyltransferase
LRFLLDGTVLQYPFSGIAKATLGLYAACKEVDPSTEVVVAHRAPLAALPSFACVPVRVPFPTGDARWRQTAIPLVALSVGHDVLHFPWNGHVPRFMARRAPVVATVNDVLPLDIPGYFPHPRDESAYRRRIQSDLNRADLVTTISHYSRRRIVEEFRVAADPCVILLGVSQSKTPETQEPESATMAHTSHANTPAEDQPFFLFSGGFDPRKRVELAIAAVCELWDLHQLRIPLVVVGEVRLYSPELERRFLRGTQMGAVRALGYVSDAKLRQLYSRATAMIYPSRFEGFGLPPLEAMAEGCPVITCRSTAIPEICGDAALYLDPTNELDSMVETLNRVATDEACRQALAEAGRLRARQFSWSTAAQTYLRAVHQIAHRHEVGRLGF